MSTVFAPHRPDEATHASSATRSCSSGALAVPTFFNAGSHIVQAIAEWQQMVLPIHRIHVSFASWFHTLLDGRRLMLSAGTDLLNGRCNSIDQVRLLHEFKIHELQARWIDR